MFNALMNHPDFTKIGVLPASSRPRGGMAVQKAVADRWKN